MSIPLILKGSVKVMKMTKREKILIGLLLVVALAYGYFQFLYTPLINEIADLEVKKVQKEAELLEIEQYMAKEGFYEAEYNKNIEVLEEIISNYYIKNHQEDIVILMKEFNESEDLLLNDFSFSDKTEQLEAIEQLSVQVDFEGSYESLNQYLNKIESNDQYIAISEVSIDTDEDGLISGELELNFMSIPALNTYLEKASLFEKNGVLVERQVDSPFNQYESLAMKQENTDPTVMESYMEDHSIYSLGNLANKRSFFVGTDQSISGKITTTSHSQYNSTSLLLDYNYGVLKPDLEANLVFEDQLLISNPHEYISVLAKSEQITNHAFGLVIVDSYGESHILSLMDSITSDAWEVYEVEMPLDVVYPARVQRVYVKSTSNDQQINGKVYIDSIMLSNTKEAEEAE